MREEADVRQQPTRRTFLAGASAAIAAGALAPGRAAAASRPASSAGRARRSALRTASLQLPAPPDHGIPRGQVFDNQIPDRTVYQGITYFVWGASSLDQPAGAVPCGYLPAFRDFDKTHDLAWYQANHPDWVAYLGQDAGPAYEFDNETYIPLDFANPAVREYYLESLVLPLVDEGYPIIGFDNVCTANVYGNCGHFDTANQWVAQYTGNRESDPAWTAAVLDWLGYLADELHSRGVGIAANITWNGSVDPADVKAAVDLVDVYVDEQGFTVHRDANYNDDDWKTKYDFAREIAADKSYLAINQTTTADVADASQAQVDWAIANFLLYREQPSLMTLCGVGQYHVFVDRPEMHTDIGAPASSPVQDSTGVWKRSYEQGRVLVNPSSSVTSVVTLPAGTWTDMHGVAYSGHITMAPNSGTVLTSS